MPSSAYYMKSGQISSNFWCFPLPRKFLRVVGLRAFISPEKPAKIEWGFACQTSHGLGSSGLPRQVFGCRRSCFTACISSMKNPR